MIFENNRVYHVTVPVLGKFAFTRDDGEAMTPGHLFFNTNLSIEHTDPSGKILGIRDLGSGAITVNAVNQIAADSLAPLTTPYNAALRRAHFMDSGTGTTAATSADTALQTPIAVTGTGKLRADCTSGPNTITNPVTASGAGTSSSQIKYSATITYSDTGPSYPLAITEWGLFDSAGSYGTNTITGGLLYDHRVFSAINVNNGDSITFNYTLSVPDNG